MYNRRIRIEGERRKGERNRVGGGGLQWGPGRSSGERECKGEEEQCPRESWKKDKGWKETRKEVPTIGPRGKESC